MKTGAIVMKYLTFSYVSLIEAYLINAFCVAFSAKAKFWRCISIVGIPFFCVIPNNKIQRLKNSSRAVNRFEIH